MKSNFDCRNNSIPTIYLNELIVGREGLPSCNPKLF